MAQGPRIVLFLDAEVGARTAAWLLDQGADVRLAVTHPAGRGRAEAQIRKRLEAARVEALPYDPEDPEGFAVRLAERVGAFDVLVSAWFGFVLPASVLDLAEQGAFNMHPSYLPWGRGKHPNVWAIVEGTPAGGSVHRMLPRVDAGPVVVRREVEVRPDDTGATLYRRCVAATEGAFREAWPRIVAGDAEGTPQDRLGEGTYHDAADLAALDRLDLDATLRVGDVLDRLRARTFAPHPGVRFTAGGREWQARVRIEPVDDAASAAPAPEYHGVTPVNDPATIEAMARDPSTADLGYEFMRKVNAFNYSYNFTWLGRPIIQYPQDVVALQEILWSARPDVVVETGIAHGGSLVLSASILELLGGDREVVGVDIDIRAHNRAAIEAHPLAHRIHMIEGSSVAPEVVEAVRRRIEGRSRVLVILDSNHSHDHVLRELELYAPFVTEGSWLIVLDTIVEKLYEGPAPDRPWGKGNNPWTAVQAFLADNPRFVLDETVEHRLLITVGPGGFLRCVGAAT